MTTESRNSLDPVLVGLVSGRLASILDEQQTALIHTAFSPVVRESYDLACAVFDSGGQMIGQSSGGTPGHINAMATGMEHIVAAYDQDALVDGDVLITNDPWMTAGQINDITVATPVFRQGRLVAWFASCCHSPDIGGRILSAEASEVFEEGLRIPIMKFREAGQENSILAEIIRANVRTPEATIGDIYAQVSSNLVGARSLLNLMDETNLDSIDEVAGDIMERSEAALRKRIAQLEDGTYTAQVDCDGFREESLTLKVSVTVQGDELQVDYGGSSDQSKYGINVVLNYTRAYTSFAIKAALAPEVPHNAGSFRPVNTTAPEGSVLNCLEPAPVASRHLVGHFLPSLLFDALRPAVQTGLPAYSADALWMTVWRGLDASNGLEKSHEFTLTTFGAGGSGGRPGKDGLTTTGFPTGVRAAPTEVIESLSPLVQLERQLITDSGGAGEYRGGLGQRIRVVRRHDQPWSVNANVDRLRAGAPGANGGSDGRAGRLALKGEGRQIEPKSLCRLQPDDEVILEFPGGGGLGHPFDRDADRVLDDVVQGYVTREAAEQVYGVCVTSASAEAASGPVGGSRMEIDWDKTTKLRAQR
ncbi:hydantoinase B/oxoprolinase family protein [Brevibacterium luteolum]|uniref:Hydantoinase B/oxoprolinase family protein n=1 Tax=Brevibacterium luteolum TaxID=199591 RepID=A0A6G8KZY9_9MICO|nr:hydantoinase B/oxoprolinase family protein [Brevibacterium luteolum]QIN30191.1 hydantoinase B/oxoprolinase family protein [Brevibacterium luteolum]